MPSVLDRCESSNLRVTGEAKMKKSWRWVRNILLTVAGLAVVLALVGYSYQVIQTHLDARRFPMKGTLIDVGGHKLNINCTGEGAPTVVLETGLGNLAMSWEKVQLGIEKFTRGAPTTGLVTDGAKLALCLAPVYKLRRNSISS